MDYRSEATQKASQSLATAETLKQRARLLRQVRAFFDDDEFYEVQPPVLGSEFVIDRHIDPIDLSMQNPATGTQQTWYLQSSPEAAMKRLMLTGIERIYSVGPVFRREEFGTRHNPEFTMLEWYRVGDQLEAACAFLSRLIAKTLQKPEANYITFAEAFGRATGLDLFTASLDDLDAVSQQNQLGVMRGFSEDWDDWVNLIFSEVVQPTLGYERPVIVTHFPASQAALARIADGDARVAERFEAFVDGIELANGYCELLDADVMFERCHAENALRKSDGKAELPIPHKLLAAMKAGLPTMSGCALGFDRLVMGATNKSRLEDVLAFPIDRI